MTNYIIYSEIRNNNEIERWYYGTYTYEQANEFAIEMNGYGYKGVWYSVCGLAEAAALGVMNMPR